MRPKWSLVRERPRPGAAGRRRRSRRGRRRADGSARDLLGAQMLLHRDRVVGAALDGGVVGDDDAFAAADAADAGDHAGGGHVAVVHPVRRERRQLEERRAGVEQEVDALARQQLAARDVARAASSVPPCMAAACADRRPRLHRRGCAQLGAACIVCWTSGRGLRRRRRGLSRM